MYMFFDILTQNIFNVLFFSRKKIQKFNLFLVILQ